MISVHVTFFLSKQEQEDFDCPIWIPSKEIAIHISKNR